MNTHQTIPRRWSDWQTSTQNLHHSILKCSTAGITGESGATQETLFSEEPQMTPTQWSTESRNVQPKQKIFTIRLSASAAEVLF
jgi:hypothetical protein